MSFADKARVWSQIIISLTNVRSIFTDNRSLASGLKAFALRLVAPATELIGWDYGANENYLKGQLRALLIRTAGAVGHEKWAGIVSSGSLLTNNEAGPSRKPSDNSRLTFQETRKLFTPAYGWASFAL